MSCFWGIDMTSVAMCFGGSKSFGQLETGARPTEGLFGVLRWRSIGRLLWHPGKVLICSKRFLTRLRWWMEVWGHFWSHFSIVLDGQKLEIYPRMPVTTRSIAFLVGNFYKASFASGMLGWGGRSKRQLTADKKVDGRAEVSKNC